MRVYCIRDHTLTGATGQEMANTSGGLMLIALDQNMVNEPLMVAINDNDDKNYVLVITERYGNDGITADAELITTASLEMQN
ncbi:hypothetical protein P7K49_032002 [Saguinus oedipus]|uniref:Uncharacterized protein n=1 Tax=Saguinus oedipus TaxID=9490 RepID=A0ABQ9TX20_SAGOE|nr:hypothetical protein P7K49_032002 [Saguinus oedipus]